VLTFLTGFWKTFPFRCAEIVSCNENRSFCALLRSRGDAAELETEAEWFLVPFLPNLAGTAGVETDPPASDAGVMRSFFASPPAPMPKASSSPTESRATDAGRGTCQPNVKTCAFKTLHLETGRGRKCNKSGEWRNVH
jgi:hypothetical protein